jgi:hypothetical protein
MVGLATIAMWEGSSWWCHLTCASWQYIFVSISWYQKSCRNSMCPQIFAMGPPIKDVKAWISSLLLLIEDSMETYLGTRDAGFILALFLGHEACDSTWWPPFKYLLSRWWIMDKHLVHIGFTCFFLPLLTSAFNLSMYGDHILHTLIWTVKDLWSTTMGNLIMLTKLRFFSSVISMYQSSTSTLLGFLGNSSHGNCQPASIECDVASQEILSSASVQWNAFPGWHDDINGAIGIPHAGYTNNLVRGECIILIAF